MHVDYLIIGGGIAGVTAAETIRQRDAAGSIRVYGDEKHALYSRVLLPHVVRGKTPEERAYLKTPEALAAKGIEFVTGVGVSRVDTAAKRVTLSSGESLEYGKLLIATGGAVRPLAIPGGDIALPFQTMDDARALIAANQTAKALVYGGGFIGLELAMSFAHFGASTTVVLRGDGFFSRVLDAESKRRVADKVRANGVEVITGAEVTAVTSADGSPAAGAAQNALKKARLSNGTEVMCTSFAAGIGIVPNVTFLADSGLDINKGVLADEYLRTNAPDVFAAGDVAESFDALLGERRVVGNWQNAMFQGRTAGTNMTAGIAGTAADMQPFTAVTTYSITVFDLPLTFVGATDMPVDERIVREMPKGAVLQFFIKHGRIVGVTCVGPFSDRAAVVKLLNERRGPADIDGALAA